MIIDYWKIIVLTLAITELAKDSIVRDHKVLPWVALGVSILISLIYAGFVESSVQPAIVRGLTAGIITTGMYKLVKDYVRAMRR